MQTEHLNAALQDNPDWLPPATASTRYRPPAADSVLAMPAAAEEAVAGFRIGSLGFLLAAGTYCEVLGPLPVAALPNVPAWFSGLLNLRADIPHPLSRPISLYITFPIFIYQKQVKYSPV